jgi:hypothetical protein
MSDDERYVDDYPTCAATYATLRIYTGEMTPDIVTATLQLEPSKTICEGKDDAHLNGWFLSSKGLIDSRDLRRHLDWVLERIRGRESELRSLQSQPAVRMDVFCYWASEQGHGGPTLNPKQMRELADLNLTIGFDCY